MHKNISPTHDNPDYKRYYRRNSDEISCRRAISEFLISLHTTINCSNSISRDPANPLYNDTRYRFRPRFAPFVVSPDGLRRTFVSFRSGLTELIQLDSIEKPGIAANDRKTWPILQRVETIKRPPLGLTVPAAAALFISAERFAPAKSALERSQKDPLSPDVKSR